MKNRLLFSYASTLLVIMIAMVVIAEIYPNLFQVQSNDSKIALTAVAVIVATITLIISIAVQFYVRGTGSYRPFNVAIIGFPKSGKTTLIVTLFQEIFSRKIRYAKATLKGESTIERLNEQIEKKEKGIPLGPTNDQTMFAYRTNIETSSGLFKEEYRVEFGDYPGEFSEQLNESEYFEEVKKTEFFKWCIEADAYIFMVDVGRYIAIGTYSRAEFVATTTKAIRQSWQHFLDYNVRNDRRAKKKPVLLIFNKMDLCSIKTEGYFPNNVEMKLILEAAFASEGSLPPVSSIPGEEYKLLKLNLEDDFSNLIDYLKSESQNFHVLYTSSFGKIDGKFADVDKILKFILPRGLLISSQREVNKKDKNY